MKPRTYIVTVSYQAQGGRCWVYVNGHDGALITDEPYPEGTAVRIEGDRAVAVKPGGSE